MSEIYFSQIREDSLVEKYISSKTNPKKIVAIGSGGCTAFSLLEGNVEQVIAVDQNDAQCALIELKKSAIKNLHRHDYLAFIGEEPSTDRMKVYQELSTSLPIYAKEYWDGQGGKIKIGINQCGVTERFYRFIGENVRNNLYGVEVWNGLFACETIEEQQAFYQKYLESPVWKTAVKILLSKTTHHQFFPGYMFANSNENDFGYFFLGQFEKEVKTKIVSSNFFLSQIVLGKYLPNKENGMPYYMTEEGFAKAKANIDKLSIKPTSLQDFLKKEHSIDAFFLSNLLDWANKTEKEEILNSIIQSKSSDAVLLLRNMLSTQLFSEPFVEHFTVDQHLSDRCMDIERSMLYQNITAGRFS